MIRFDDIREGDRFSSSSRTILDADIVNFAGVSGDFNRLHMDDTYAAGSPYGRRIAHGLLVSSVVSGLRSRIDDYAVLAFLETTRRFTKPVFPGDTITVHYEVATCVPSMSRPTMGVVTLSVRVVNQSGEVVQDGSDILALERAQA